MVQASALTRDFWFIRAWCNGSIRVSKTFDLGSNPSARAKVLFFLKLLICSHEQDHNLLQRKLQRVTRKSDLANLESVATKYRYCTCGYCNHYRNGVGYGLFKQPIAEVDLFIIQVI